MCIHALCITFLLYSFMKLNFLVIVIKLVSLFCWMNLISPLLSNSVLNQILKSPKWIENMVLFSTHIFILVIRYFCSNCVFTCVYVYGSFHKEKIIIMKIIIFNKLVHPYPFSYLSRITKPASSCFF